jgi:biopolymer transport protein ExbB/TolQ
VALRAIPAVEFAKHASERAASRVHEELKIGLNGLATVASIAPFIGMFGTLIGIWDAPQPLGTEKTTAMANLFGRLSNACVPMAMGLFVGLVSQCGYRYLSGVLAFFDGEMESAVHQLAKDLTAHQSRSK